MIAARPKGGRIPFGARQMPAARGERPRPRARLPPAHTGRRGQGARTNTASGAKTESTQKTRPLGSSARLAFGE